MDTSSNTASNPREEEIDETPQEKNIEKDSSSDEKIENIIVENLQEEINATPQEIFSETNKERCKIGADGETIIASDGKISIETINETPQEKVDERSKDMVCEIPKEIVYAETAQVIVDETSQEIIDEPKQEIIDETPQEIINEMPQEIIDEIPQEIIDETKQEIINETPQEIIDEKPQEIIDEMPQEIIDETKQEIIDETKQEIITENPQETINEMFEEECIDQIEKPKEINQTLTLNSLVTKVERDAMAVSSEISDALEERKIEAELKNDKSSTNNKGISSLSDMEYSSDENCRDMKENSIEYQYCCLDAKADWNNESKYTLGAIIKDPFEMVGEVNKNKDNEELIGKTDTCNGEWTNVNNTFEDLNEERISTIGKNSKEHSIDPAVKIVSAEHIPQSAIFNIMEEILTEIEDKKNDEDIDVIDDFCSESEESEIKIDTEDPKPFVPSHSNPPKRSLVLRIIRIILGCFNCFQGHNVS